MRHITGVRALIGRNPNEHHRASTPLELLFDLIIVIAIAQVTAAFHHAISAGHGRDGLLNFVFLFLAIWWAWINFTWFASAFDNDDPLYRAQVGVIMVGLLIFAGGAGSIFETFDFSWALLGWVIMRVGQASLWLRASADPHHRATALRYAAGIVFAQACWVATYFGTPTGSSAYLAASVGCFLVEWSVPIWAEKAGITPFHRHHIIERYGLLTIISLGEIMLATAMAFGLIFDTPSTLAVVTALSSFAIVFSVWWLYFTADEHLVRMEFAHIFAWGYLHVFIFMGIALLGAGLGAYGDLAAHHVSVTEATLAWYVGAPLAMVYATLWLVRDRYHRLGARLAVLPLGAVAALVLASQAMPVWAFAALAVLVLLLRVPMIRTTSP